jgi:ribulose kinase
VDTIDTRLCDPTIAIGNSPFRYYISHRLAINMENCDICDLFLGVDAGTESLRSCIFTGEGTVLHTESVPYSTYFPHNGYVEQDPHEWEECMGKCVRSVVRTAQIDPARIKALAIDATCCSVVALDSNAQPLRPCLLWMDARSAQCAADILTLGQGDAALSVNCGGHGPLSAEWMLPKSLWLKRNELSTWNNATYICEKLDFLNYHLTGRMVASACNVAARWHFNAHLAVTGDRKNNRCGRPVSLLTKIDMLDILDKWPQEVLAMGEPIGRLTSAAAAHLGLTTSTVVVQGGPDAYVAMVGLGCIHSGDVALITGSSHLHLRVVSDSIITQASLLPTTDSSSVISDAKTETEPETVGYWGSYAGAPLSHMSFSEGGQSSTGAVASWARKLLSGPLLLAHVGNASSNDSTGGNVSSSGVGGGLAYSELDKEAELIEVGAEGLMVLEVRVAMTPHALCVVAFRLRLEVNRAITKCDNCTTCWIYNFVNIYVCNADISRSSDAQN